MLDIFTKPFANWALLRRKPNLIPGLLVLISLCLPIPSELVADFNSGLEAFRKGDYATALKEWRPLAEQGNADAQLRLGSIYSLGLSVPQDDKEAVRWFRLSADQGNADAQYFLGSMFYSGSSVPQDFKEAVRWFRLSADQGNANAQLRLGLMNEQGRGVPQDYVQAHMWYNLAGANGHDRAANRRDSVAKMMTPQQMAEAQRLAGEWGKTLAPAPSQPKLQDNEPETAPRMSSAGTGFVCGADLIATNYHVIQDGSRWEITFPTSGRTYPLQLVTADKTNDVAVLRLVPNTGLGNRDRPKPLQISSFSPAKIGEDLFIIGFPLGNLLGSSHKVATGVLSSSSGIDDDPRMFQITVPIQPGNSGGPIFNSEGQVIGILVSTLSAEYLFQTQRHIPQNINFAIKSDYLLALIPQQKIQKANLSSLSRADQVEVLRDSIGQVKTVRESIKRDRGN